MTSKVAALLANTMQRSLFDLRKKIAALDEDVEPALKEDVEQLEQQAALLNETLNARGKITRFIAVFKDLSPLFAFLAFCVSFFTLLLTFFWLKPEVRAIKSPTLTVSYLPKTGELGFDFKATIVNFGRQADFVKFVQAELSSPSMASHKIYFSSRTGDVILKNAADKVTFPLTLREKTAMDVNIHMSQVLGSSTREMFFKAGQTGDVSRTHTLQIDLKTESNRDASAQYCLELREEVLADIEKGQTKEILGDCGGGG